MFPYIDIMRQLAQAPVQVQRNPDIGLIEVTAGYVLKNTQVYSQVEAEHCLFDREAEVHKTARLKLQDQLYGALRLELIGILALVQTFAPQTIAKMKLQDQTITWLRSLIDQLTPYSSDAKKESQHPTAQKAAAP